MLLAEVLCALPELEEFDCSFQPELDPKRLAELKSLRFVEKHLSTLILGPPGVGKTHIAVGLGMEALRRGYMVRYTTLDDLVRDLRKAERASGTGGRSRRHEHCTPTRTQEEIASDVLWVLLVP
jgi:DNA replication protein DnaC